MAPGIVLVVTMTIGAGTRGQLSNSSSSNGDCYFLFPVSQRGGRLDVVGAQFDRSAARTSAKFIHTGEKYWCDTCTRKSFSIHFIRSFLVNSCVMFWRESFAKLSAPFFLKKTISSDIFTGSGLLMNPTVLYFTTILLHRMNWRKWYYDSIATPREVNVVWGTTGCLAA